MKISSPSVLDFQYKSIYQMKARQLMLGSAVSSDFDPVEPIGEVVLIQRLAHVCPRVPHPQPLTCK